MKGDFSRLTFDPAKHYRGVLLQQGRVQVDADWNEQAEIEAHVEETSTRDVVGPVGGPYQDAAFGIRCGDDPVPPGGCSGSDLRLSPGRYYVDGILCEVEAPVPLFAQPDLPDVAEPTGPTGPGVSYLAYLDVWREHVTALEEPGMREVALGGPDTATRTRTVWQVRLLRNPGGACSTFEGGWVPPGAASTGRLRARAAPPAPLADPCEIPPAAGFRRLENQLYRVEIHDGSEAAGGPTFTWSRDNGAVVVGLVDIAEKVITVSEPGKDEVRGFAPDQWIELSDRDRELRGEPGILVKLSAVRGTELTVTGWPGGSAVTMADFGRAPIVRRWDSPGAVPLRRGRWLDLEDGVQVMFEDDATQEYRTGDYWVVPARTANLSGDGESLGGDVEWPTVGGEPQFRSRHGIEHRYAPIALLRRTGSTWRLSADCRRIFPPLTELARFFYVGGDGQEAMPGAALPQLLQVGVSNGRWPVPGAHVRFETAAGGRLAEGHAALAGADGSVDVATDGDGIAAAAWLPNPAGPHSQQAVATLRDDQDRQVGLPIVFGANLSVASQVAYDAPENCAVLSDAATVQDALDRLSAAAMLVRVSGDGQLAMPGMDLPEPVVVEAASDCGPVRGATVKIVADGGGSVRDLDGGDAADAISVETGDDGRAGAVWRPAADVDNPVRVLTAELVDAPIPVRPPTAVQFTANLSLDRNVAYTGECEDLQKAETVQQALDLLCEIRQERPPAIRVRDVILLGTEKRLENDSPISPELLRRGIAISSDRPIALDAIEGKPVWTVTVELPYPFSAMDRERWGHLEGTVGFQPIVLAGGVDQGQERTITWFPREPAAAWLDEVLDEMPQFNMEPRLLARMNLEGNFIWDAEDPRVLLDGDTFGVPADGRTQLRRDRQRLLSGDGRPGGDFRMWLWLVPP